MFLNKNIVYPDISVKNGIQGRVLVGFVITQDGNVKDAEVVGGVDPYLDAEALRLVRMMPKWKPGKQGGKPVNVKYTLPITFRLQ
jgi:protein TonB